MIKNFKKLSILLFTSIFLFSSVEANWITKKSDKSKEIIKQEKKQKSEWIKLKKKEIKKNKEDYKKKEKNISKAVKSWITRKTKKDKFLEINSLPNSQIYFTAYADDGRIFYGYINDDKKSEKIKFQGTSIYKISKGKGFIQNNKAICNIATERGVIANNIIGFVSGECSDKTKFTGEYNQKRMSGNAETDQKININFNFNENLKNSKDRIAQLNKKKDIPDQSHSRTKDSVANVTLNPTGKYYALLIGNSNYVKWSKLKSPKNDVAEIAKVLENKYKFEKVITLLDGSKSQMFKAFKELSKITTDKDYVLIYYSGHGDIMSNQRYWIPINGSKEYGFGDWVNLSDIEVYITNEISAHHLAIISDSCYFNINTKGSSKYQKSKTDHYQKLLNKRARLVISSGYNEPVADTSSDKHSLFALSIIQSLKNNKNVIQLRDVFTDMELAHSGLKQQPVGYPIQAWGHGGGDLIFISRK
ncbi:caspase family protein [Candidatus Pelagibacter bacterium]|nr:caspase family protein [Candidatus Pelagibacter bacterium]